MKTSETTTKLLCVTMLFAFACRGICAPGASFIDRLSDGRIRPSETPGLRVAYLPIIFPSSHAANLISLKNGDLLCAYYSGLWEGKAGVAIVISRLARGASQWTRPVVAAEEAARALENPVLFESPLASLWLFYTSQRGEAGQADAQILYQESKDNGRDWTTPKVLFDKPGSFDRQGLLIDGNRWLFPLYFTPGSDIDDHSAIEISEDQGLTWKECLIPGSNGLVQPDVVELSPHSFAAFLRSRFADWVYSSHSKDGCSWTIPQPTQIPNNNSSIQVTRLHDGHLVMAFNNIQAATTRGKPRDMARWPMSVALSADGGNTWPWVRDVDIGQGVPQEPVPDTMAGADVRDEQQKFFEHLIDYSYPSIIETADGKIHMAYTYRRRTIKYATFDESWIKMGTTLGFFSGDRLSGGR
jgi:predicted neuraminidase